MATIKQAVVRTASEYRTQAILWINDIEKTSALLSVCACWILAAKVTSRDKEGFTAATDGVSVLLNPTWFSTMSVKERAFVFCHEAMHGILRHIPQMRSILGDQIKGRVAKMTNIAQDAWINYVIGKVFGKDGEYFRPSFGGVHYDSKFKHPKTGKMVPLFKDADQFNPDDHDWYWLYQRLNREGADGQGEGIEGGGDLEPGDEDSDIEAETQAARAVTQAAVRASQLQAGNTGGWLERLLGAATQPVHNWKNELWQAANACIPSEYSFRRINKTYACIGATVGTISRPGMGPVAVFMDTSGSITEEMLAQPIAEVSAIIKDLRPERVYQLWVDAEVAHVQVFEPDLPLDPEPKGGGGTDFAPAFKWIEENVPEPLSLAVYFTDLYADYSNLVAPPYPVIWAVLKGGREDPPPFGKVIRIGW